MLLLCLAWSLQQISLKAASTDVSPMLMVALRSGLAALLVAAVMLWRGERLALRTGRWRPGLLVGALFAIEFLFLAEAMRFTHAGHVVVFIYTAPIFAALGLHWKLPAERLRRLQWVGIAIAFAGIATAFLGRGVVRADVQALDILFGDLLALLAGAFWGATTVTIRLTRLGSAPATETLLYQLVVAFALLMPVALWSGQSHFNSTPAAWGHLAFQGVVVTFASYLVWFWLLRRYLASRLGVLSFLTPVLGVLLGIVLLQEPLETSFLAGSGLVLFGVFLVGAHRGLGQVLRGGGRGRRAD